MSRVPGVGQVTIFGAGNYAMRFWVDPDTLSKLGITVSEILDALQKQNTVNPAGQIGGEPVPPGQQFTYTVRAQGRLTDEKQFGDIVVRANVDGSVVRMRDVARIELGRADLQHDRPPERLAGGDHRHLPAARLERDRHHEPGRGADGGGQDALSRRPRLRGLARHDAGGHRGHQARSSRRCSRRSSSSSSSSSSSCRASAPR